MMEVHDVLAIGGIVDQYRKLMREFDDMEGRAEYAEEEVGIKETEIEKLKLNTSFATRATLDTLLEGLRAKRALWDAVGSDDPNYVRVLNDIRALIDAAKGGDDDGS